ncbi:multicopper oxidase [Xylariaceae sp. FL0255]|nr:multicopper oxidase [Xylariaceae sp. FL0255]
MLRTSMWDNILALIVGLPFTFALSLPSDKSENVLRTFDYTLSWEEGKPNGVSRDMIFINGQFPGPMLEINEGDDVLVTVHNTMPFNASIHFHGVEQYGTPWSDGVPGLSQRQILSGASFEYRWTATQYGEYWYHAHTQGQIDDGLFGPIVIHPSDTTETPFKLISQDEATIAAMENAAANIQPLMLSDWRNIDSITAWNIIVNASSDLPCLDSLLINGKGRIECWSAEKLASLVTPEMAELLAAENFTSLTPKGCLPKPVALLALDGTYPTNASAIPDELFDVCNSTDTPNASFNIEKQSNDVDGTWAAFDVVGVYTTFSTSFSIDGLPMWVYAVDGQYIEPQLVNAISVVIGERYSFLVHLTEPGDYTIRHASTLPIQLISGQGTISYASKGSCTKKNQTVPTQYINDGGAAIGTDVVFFSEAISKPYPPSPIAQTANQTFILTIGNSDDRGYIWSMNGTPAPSTLEEDVPPVLFDPHPYIQNGYTITTLNNTWIDIIFVSAEFPQPAHPFHKHGVKLWQIGSGQGVWNYSSVEEAMQYIPQSFNLLDPPRRDGFSTLDALDGPTWVAVRYHVNNPGAWFLHCHILAHFMGGMELVIQDGVDHWPQVPEAYLQAGT